MFGKSAAAIQNYLLDTDVVNPAYCASLLQRAAKKKSADVMAAVEGFKMSAEQKERVRIIQEHFSDINARVARLDAEINKLVSEYESRIALLCTIPGVDRNLAINASERRYVIMNSLLPEPVMPAINPCGPWADWWISNINSILVGGTGWKNS